MKILTPKIPQQLTTVIELEDYLKKMIEEEFIIYHISTSENMIEDKSFQRLHMQQSTIRKSGFQNCDFEKSTFIDVIFENCDFSNSKFVGAYFERCRFISCKCMGVDMREVMFKHMYIEESNFKYAYLDKIRISCMLLKKTDMTEVSITEAELKNFEVNKSIFHKNDFFKTSLDGMDFSDNEFLKPIVSEPPIELKGITVNMTQASELISYWGVKVSI